MLQVNLSQDELQRIITEAKQELGCVETTCFLAFSTVLKYHISEQGCLLASDVSPLGSENWQSGMKRRRMKELNLNRILTETWETFLKPLQVAANNKRVTMTTAWRNMNWINMTRRIQVETNSDHFRSS